MKTLIRLMFLCAFLPSFGYGDEPIVIENSSTPEQGLQTLLATELWRVGGPDDEETIFGQVVRVVGDPDGRTYVFDAQLQQAFVYDTAGDLAATLFGPGDGPGEIRRARDLVFMPDGTIAAVNMFPAGLVKVQADGTPAGSLMIPTPGRGFNSAVQRGGNLVVAERANVDHDDGTHTVQSILGSLQADGERTVVYLQSDRHVDYQNDYVFDERRALVDFLFSYDVGPDGRVYALADADRYATSVFSPNGNLERVIERDFEPRRRTEAEAARLRALTERRFRTFPFGISFVFAETEAVVPWYFRGLQVRDDGTLWVRHSRSAELGRAAGALVVFDVFDAAGRFDRQVAVPVPGRAATDGIFFVGGDRFVVVHGFVDAMCSVVGGGRGEMGDVGVEPDPVEVVCYRIDGIR